MTEEHLRSQLRLAISAAYWEGWSEGRSRPSHAPGEKRELRVGLQAEDIVLLAVEGLIQEALEDGFSQALQPHWTREELSRATPAQGFLFGLAVSSLLLWPMLLGFGWMAVKVLGW